MKTIKEIEIEWNLWKELPFPSEYASEEIAGICLVSLDTFTAGCIDTFISNRGYLDSRNISVLENNEKELKLVVDKLNKNAGNYFKKLLHLITDTLDFINKH